VSWFDLFFIIWTFHSCNSLPAAWDGGGINITHPVRSASHSESKTGEKEAREADFPTREEKTNCSWLPELAKYVKKRQNCVKTDKMADKTIVTVAQVAQVLVATKQLKENGKEANNLKLMDRYCITKSKMGQI
jgi:hypothetical protein